MDLQAMDLVQVVTAIGGLGTAAYGLVDATKSTFKGINRIGLKHIQETVTQLTPDDSGGAPPNALPQKNILATVAANWINGNDLGNQKAIAKSLIKLHISPGNAAELATRTNVDPALLASVATKQRAGTQLEPAESDVLGRFDLITTAMLDEAFQSSDNDYRNGTRTLAALYAVILSLAGGWSLEGNLFLQPREIFLALLVGLLATPLAPIAKDIATALTTAVNALQAAKGKK